MDFLPSAQLTMEDTGIPYIIRINDSSVEGMYGVYFGVKWIQFVTTILSILGSGSIIGYAVFQNTVKSPEVRPLFYLSLSDLFLALCWLIGAVMYRRAACTKNVPCYNIQVLGQMFYFSTFLYTLNYTWQLCSTLKTKLDGDLYKVSNKKWCIGRIMTVLSSVIPVLVTVPVLYYGNANECYGNSTHPHSCLVLNIGSHITSDPRTHTNSTCKNTHYYSAAIFLGIYFFTAILILVILGNVYILSRKYLVTRGPFRYQQWVSIHVTKRSLLLYPMIFFFCSVPAVTLTLIKLASHKGKNEDYAILYFIQAFTAGSQGLLNCMVYGWTLHMIRSLKQSACRDVNTQTPLLRSQKKLYASTQTSNSNTVPHRLSAL
ncbi:transmembrane protein 116 [Rhinophrynus dorsalis]